MTDAVGLAQRLVRLNTAGGGELAAAEICAAELEAAGARVELVTMDAGRAHLLASVGDVTDTSPVLSGHLDTVPAGDVPWTHGALSGDISEGMLHGRGAADMKGGVAALVVAVARHAARGDREPGALLVLTAGEETGCSGARHLVGARQLPVGGPLLIAEPTGLEIAHGHKGVLWLTATSRGVSAHGSRPDLGQSAILPLARFVAELAESGLPGSHPEMGGVTVNVGTFHGGTKINLVPDLASAELDIRVVPGVDSADLRARVGALAGPGISIETTEDLPAVYSPADGPFAAHVSTCCQRIVGASVERPPLTYFTDASVLAGALASSEIVLLGPGEPDSAHTLDECCPTSQIEAAADLYEDILASWKAGTARS